MNIVIYGAGAIGSLFGAILSNKHPVKCVARKDHVQAVQSKGLTITGKTKMNKSLLFFETIDDINDDIDLLILTVKSFDTLDAAKQIKSSLSKNTIVFSLQNGLTNIDDLIQYIPKKNIIAGITSWGAVFKRPGLIQHTGKGDTIIGELDGNKTDRIRKISQVLNEVGISNDVSEHIQRDIWKKAIVNSSINPLTAIFQVKNGYLMKNPILTALVEKICIESTVIANQMGFDLNINHMIEITKKVIEDTKRNESSMLQSLKNHKKTEIASINESIFLSGKKMSCEYFLNKLMVKIILSI